MTATLSFPDVSIMAIPLYISLILLELAWITYSKKGGRYETRDALTSLAMGAGSVVEKIVFGFIAWSFFVWVWQYRMFDLGTGPLTIAACVVLNDFRYYWVHRLGHVSRWVWASHVNHHSSQHYNLTTALRQTWTGTFTFMMVLHVPLLLLGFHPALILFIHGINLVYQFWIHTEAIDKMPPWFEFVMNTPSHHRVHHGRNARYLDTNYAGMFIVWDRLFGTFVPEDADAPVDFGLVHNLGTFNPIRVAVHEWLGLFKDATRPGLSFRDRIMYAFAPPGWSHDGSRGTSKTIKANALARHPENMGKSGY